MLFYAITDIKILDALTKYKENVKSQLLETLECSRRYVNAPHHGALGNRYQVADLLAGHL